MTEIGGRIGWPGWETVRRIGVGSFGAVYEIERTLFGITEKAALKVVSIPQQDSEIDALRSQGCRDERISQRFFAQAQEMMERYALIRRMDQSAHIVTVDDIRIVQQDNDLGWDVLLKMELLTPLPTALPVAVPEKEVVRIARDLCLALSQCERFGLVHRDIKPQNLFVSPTGQYKLGDFSIAKSVEEASAARGGTYNYMAPEVYHGLPYGFSADIYSLGLVLYWLLNERRGPFLPLPPEAVSFQMTENALNRRFCGESIPAPAHGSEALRKIVLNACACEQSVRYQSAEQMLHDLDRLSLSCPSDTQYAPAQGDGHYHINFCRADDQSPKPEYPSDPTLRPASECAFTVCGDFDSTLGIAPALAPSDAAPEHCCSPFDDTLGPGHERKDAVCAAEEQEGKPSSVAPRPARKSWGDVIGGLFARKSSPSRLDPKKQAAAEAVLESTPLPPVKTSAEDELQSVEFSVVAPKGLVRGEYALVHVIMYEKAFRFVVDRLAEEQGSNSQERRSGTQRVKPGAAVKVLLASPDLSIEDPLEEGVWQGEHLDFSFAVLLPEDYSKRQVLMQASVYIDGVITTRLKFVFDCASGAEQKPKVSRRDIVSAFISYARQDRKRVAAILQGMQKARPDLDVFFDVDGIQSGDSWEKVLRREIDRRDVLFLFWSQNARASKWVETEWRYALERKGTEAVEPVPLEFPDKCPPPKELEHKFFGDKLLYIINSSL